MRPTGRPAYHTGFLSTLSLRRATASVFLIGSRSQFLSTLSLRRATRTGLTCGDGRNISIHALLAESDKLVNVHNNPTTKFLSTLSLRRATVVIVAVLHIIANFYPRSPCGERRSSKINSSYITAYFYPRSPCGERLPAVPSPILRMLFLSTLSLRRATTDGSICFDSRELFLSTLSLRRATCGLPAGQPITPDFYPRSPCGERHDMKMRMICTSIDFYPRSPCGERL